MKRRCSHLFFSRSRFIILDAFTGTWKERCRKRKEMTSRRSLPRGTYVLYPPRVTLRSFVEGFRVHDVPTGHVQLSGSLSLSLSLLPPLFHSTPSLFLSLSRQNIESRYLRFLVVSRPRRSRVRNVRHGHATCVRVITRSQSLPSFAFTRTYIRHTCIADAVLRRLSSHGNNSFVA